MLRYFFHHEESSSNQGQIGFVRFGIGIKCQMYWNQMVITGPIIAHQKTCAKKVQIDQLCPSLWASHAVNPRLIGKQMIQIKTRTFIRHHIEVLDRIFDRVPTPKLASRSSPIRGLP
jgi:hypothetical protein